jgi:hypothetical protein
VGGDRLSQTLRVVRDADPAGLRDPFKAGGDIDAIANDIVFIDYA